MHLDLHPISGGLRARRPWRRAGRPLAVAGLLLILAGCRQDMHDQPRLEPLEASVFFADGRGARPVIPGTVARGEEHLRADELFYTGKVNGRYAEEFPEPVTLAMLRRGQERYNIFCAPCHSQVGDGLGMIVQRGLRPPPSFHEERLRAAPPGYFFDVITNGFGVMYSYGDRIKPADRWAIAAYIRALQLSQNGTQENLPPEDWEKAVATK